MSSIRLRMNAQVGGNGKSTRTLVFSHGFGTDHHAWDKVAEAFASDFQLISFDHAGSADHGSGPLDGRRYSRLMVYADDLVELAQDLGLKDAILVGHSAGASIGLLAAIKSPESFSKLVLLGANPCYLNDGEYVGGFTRDDFVGLYTLMMQDYTSWIGNFVPFVTATKEPSHLSTYLSLILGRLEPERALRMSMAVFESDIREWLSLVTHPTLLLQSSNDPVVPLAAAEYLHREISGSTLKLLEATGHFAHIESPGEVIAAINSFVRA